MSAKCQYRTRRKAVAQRISFPLVILASKRTIHFSWEGTVVRLIAFALVAYCYFQPGFSLAADTAGQLAGSWKLTSWTIQVIDGEAAQPFGPNPKGRAVFTPDGFSAFMIARPDRKPATNDADAAALLKSLMVYTGKFTIDGDKLTTNVDLSWNEIFTGTAQVRFFKLEGDKLSIRTGEQASAVYPGKRVVGTLTWERER
jgi:hypothetical protein